MVCHGVYIPRLRSKGARSVLKMGAEGFGREPSPLNIPNSGKSPRRKKRYWEQHMWAKGYFAVTVGNLNEQRVQKYIEEQEMHHKRDNFEISSH